MLQGCSSQMGTFPKRSRTNAGLQCDFPLQRRQADINGSD